MVGSNTSREIAEPIYRDMLRQMSDEVLESEARAWVWLCETTFNGPWPEDVWHRDCVRQEFERRERLEIFLHAEQRILTWALDFDLGVSDRWNGSAERCESLKG
jgi:hypothetical protein